MKWFTEITEEAGLVFSHESDEDNHQRMPEVMGSGCAMFDYDGDGDLDLYLINGNYSLSGRLSFAPILNRLYRQEDDGTFTDVTDSSGLGDASYGFGIVVGDYDNDGDVDVYLTNYGLDRLYQNNGDGTFTDVSETAGIVVDAWSSSAAFFDYDRDGHLDLYIARYVIYDPSQQCSDAAGRLDYCGPQVFEYESDVLLHNNGDGTFSDVSIESGIAKTPNPGLGVVCEDFNGDGWPDVAVANDGDVNYLWINQQDGTFRERAVAMGIGFNMHGAAEAGMGILAEDFNDDGITDLFMTHLSNQTNTLFAGRADGMGFDDRTGITGLADSSHKYTGFGAAAFDVDLDGDLDLLVANGKVQRSDPIGQSSMDPPWDVYAEPNLLYRNEGGNKYVAVRDELSTFSSRVEVSRGLATGDIDRDGDLDVLLSNTQGPARLYRNDAPRKGHWLMIKAFDERLNRDAIGAKVTVRIAGRSLTRTVRAACSYLSSNDLFAHFGLGSADQIEQVEILWPDGLREVFKQVQVDQYNTLTRGNGEAKE